MSPRSVQCAKQMLCLVSSLLAASTTTPAASAPATSFRKADAPLSTLQLAPADLVGLSKMDLAELSVLSEELDAQLTTNQKGGGTNHLYFYWIKVADVDTSPPNDQCGQIDAARLVPAALFKRPIRLLLYVQATISLFVASPFKGPQPGELKLGQCQDHGYTHDAHLTVGSQWTPIDLQGPVCEKRCQCQWPAYRPSTPGLPACTDQPDDPSAGRFCSLCGPNAPGNCGGLSGSACTQGISIWRKGTVTKDGTTTNQTVPNSCNAGCIPEHVKVKVGKPLCCTEGHTSLKCPRPAHYHCGAASPQPSPPPTPPSPPPSPSPTPPSHSPGSQIWSFKTGNVVDASPALSSDGKVVFIGSWDNSLYAVNATTGSKIWNFPTGNWVDCTPTVSSDGKVVYVGSDDGNVYAVNALNGSKIWSFPTGGQVSSPAVSSDGKVVYVGMMSDENFFALNASTGSEIWSFATGGQVPFSPALSSDDKVVYFGDASGVVDSSLYAVNALTGSKIWSVPTGNGAQSSPALSSDGKVVYVGIDNNLYAVNALTGSKIWSFATGDSVESTPVLSSDGKVVYVGSADNSLYAVNALTGSKIWSFATGGYGTSTPALSSDGKVVYVGSDSQSDDNSLYAVNAVTGSKIWSFPTSKWVSSPLLSSDGKMVYIGSENGYLYAVNA